MQFEDLYNFFKYQELPEDNKSCYRLLRESKLYIFLETFFTIASSQDPSEHVIKTTTSVNL